MRQVLLMLVQIMLMEMILVQLVMLFLQLMKLEMILVIVSACAAFAGTIRMTGWDECFISIRPLGHPYPSTGHR